MDIQNNTVVTLHEKDLAVMALAIYKAINHQEPDIEFKVEELNLGFGVKVQIDCELLKSEHERSDSYKLWKAEITGSYNGEEVDEFKYSVNEWESNLDKLDFKVNFYD